MPAQDSTAQRLQALADEAIDVSGLDDAHLLQRLRALDLDVLVDLAEHATSNRIGVIAQRVAPLRMCWLDWFDTTAVAAMDAWISDDWLTPIGSTQRYSEQVVRLASARFCYTPADAAPPARFAARGIAATQLRLHRHLPYSKLLAAWRRVDIALDPFPFSGCTTTCDALWMRCPTITLPGETFVSRQSASLLWRLGRDEWVARDRADYVERAIELAANIESVRAGCEPLREAMRISLCDAQAQAQAQANDFAAAVRTLWRGRCAVPSH